MKQKNTINSSFLASEMYVLYLVFELHGISFEMDFILRRVVLDEENRKKVLDQYHDLISSLVCQDMPHKRAVWIVQELRQKVLNLVARSEGSSMQKFLLTTTNCPEQSAI